MISFASIITLMGGVVVISSEGPETGQVIDRNTGQVFHPFIDEYSTGRNEAHYRETVSNPNESLQIGAFYHGRSNHLKLEEAIGYRFEALSQYVNIRNITNPKFLDNLKWMTDNYSVRINILFFPGSELEKTLLADIAAGYYDGQLREFSQGIIDRGIRDKIQITFLHEFNFHYYPWAMFYGDNTRDEYKRAFRHIVGVLRDTGVNYEFMLHYNRNTLYVNKVDYDVWYTFEEMYPGDEWVDVIGVSSFNRAYTGPWHAEWRSFRTDFQYAYDQITAFTDKPIYVAEVASTDYINPDLERDSAKKADWIVETMNDIVKYYPQIQGITWFTLNKQFNHADAYPFYWSLNTQDEATAFGLATGLKK